MRKADVFVANEIAHKENETYMDNVTTRFTFVHYGPVYDSVIHTALTQRGYVETTDARWFSSQNHPCSLDNFVEVLVRPGTGDIRWQDCDPDFVPALTEWAD